MIDEEFVESHAQLVERLKSDDYGDISFRMSNEGMLDFRHGLTGLLTELGELEDVYKRHVFYGTEITQEVRENVLEEFGDLMYYLTLGLSAWGFTVEQAQEHNMNKLNKRYGSGSFSKEQAVERADKK